MKQVNQQKDTLTKEIELLRVKSSDSEKVLKLQKHIEDLKAREV